MRHPTDRIAHTTAFVTPVVEHWLEREIIQWVRPTKDPSDDLSHHERTPLPRSYISLPEGECLQCTCQCWVMECQTPTLPVWLSATSWLPMKNSESTDTFRLNTPVNGKGKEMFYLTMHSDYTHS